MNNPLAYTRSHQEQSGISLVEILVALAIGLFLTAGTIQILIANKQSYRLQENLSRMQENGRFAMQILTSNIREAGYQGCSSSNVSSNITNTLNNPSSYYSDFSKGIQGYDYSTSAWSPPLPSAITSPLEGSDIIVIRKSEGTGLTPLPNGASGNYSTSPSADLKAAAGNGLSQCDIAVISDCAHSSIFQISSADPNGSGSIAHNTGSVCSNGPNNGTKDLGTTYKSDAQIMKIATTSYYLRTTASGTPSLYRKVNSNSAEELVEGVEDMQITYGVDANGNGFANYYTAANNITDWSSVVSVHISLLLRTLDDNLTASAQTYQFNGASTTATDKRLREVASTTIAIRNHLK